MFLSILFVFKMCWNNNCNAKYTLHATQSRNYTHKEHLWSTWHVVGNCHTENIHWKCFIEHSREKMHLVVQAGGYSRDKRNKWNDKKEGKLN